MVNRSLNFLVDIENNLHLSSLFTLFLSSNAYWTNYFCPFCNSNYNFHIGAKKTWNNKIIPMVKSGAVDVRWVPLACTDCEVPPADPSRIGNCGGWGSGWRGSSGRGFNTRIYPIKSMNSCFKVQLLNFFPVKPITLECRKQITKSRKYTFELKSSVCSFSWKPFTSSSVFALFY